MLQFQAVLGIDPTPAFSWYYGQPTLWSVEVQRDYSDLTLALALLFRG
jgi:hypothetical protein